jgi:alpha-tubulin suppressor-like RCC1 family protein
MSACRSARKISEEPVKSILRPVMGLAAIVVVGCSEESGPNISGVAAFDIRRVEVSPLVDTVFIPDTVRATDRRQLTARAFGLGSQVLPVNRYVWTSADTTVALVNEDGVVIPRKLGTVEISASATRIGRATVVILPAANRVVISPQVDTIFYDDPGITARDTVRLIARTLDRSGAPLPGARYSWQSGTPAVVSVDSTGQVRAVGAGTSTVTVRSGEVQTTATVHVLPVIRNVTATASVARVLDGDTLQLTAAAFGYDGATVPRTFRWQSSNPAVAQIDENGRVIFVSTGNATFTATTAFRTATATVEALPRELLTVAAGRDFACGIAPLGRGYCWGEGASGKLGSPPDSICANEAGIARDCAIAPKRHTGTVRTLTTLDAGDESACAIDTANLLYCWGRGSSGEIGNGAFGESIIPVAATVRSERFTAVSVGGAHACALNLEGRAFCWGNDRFGQLGDNRKINSSTPIPVVGPDGQEARALRFSAISAGWAHTCAVEQLSGRAYCWGNNAQGQLGTNDVTDSEVPRLVDGALSFVKIAADSTHSCGVTTTQALYCWGSNAQGQLSGSSSESLTPVLIGSGYADVTAGADFTCALSTGGEIRCFGSNSHGQLGRGEGNLRGERRDIAPVVGGLTWRSLSAGARHVCAIDTAGESWCWGTNEFGALGNALQAAVRSSPQRVARLR